MSCSYVTGSFTSYEMMKEGVKCIINEVNIMFFSYFFYATGSLRVW